MKRLVLFLLTLVFSLALVACIGEEGDPDHIVVAFVPSNSASAVITRATELAEMLEERVPGKTFEIILGTDYDAVVEGMLAGTIHVGFLTGQQYAAVTTEYPGSVEVLLTSVRKGFEVQFDDEGNILSDAEVLANMQDPGYRAQLADINVNYYHSILIVPADSDIESVEDLAGKTVATQAETSGSGFVYPAVLLDQHDMKFVTGTPNAAAGEVKYQIFTGHPSAAEAVYLGDVDTAFTFMDARLNLFEDKDDIFEATKVIALTPGIYNDTISAISSLSTDLKEAIEDAFIDIISTAVGLDILSVYSHTGYLKADDEDYEGERTVYKFKRDNLS